MAPLPAGGAATAVAVAAGAVEAATSRANASWICLSRWISRLRARSSMSRWSWRRWASSAWASRSTCGADSAGPGAAGASTGGRAGAGAAGASTGGRAGAGAAGRACAVAGAGGGAPGAARQGHAERDADREHRRAGGRDDGDAQDGPAPSLGRRLVLVEQGNGHQAMAAGAGGVAARGLVVRADEAMAVRAGEGDHRRGGRPY